MSHSFLKKKVLLRLLPYSIRYALSSGHFHCYFIPLQSSLTLASLLFSSTEGTPWKRSQVIKNEDQLPDLEVFQESHPRRVLLELEVRLPFERHPSTSLRDFVRVNRIKLLLMSSERFEQWEQLKILIEESTQREVSKQEKILYYALKKSVWRDSSPYLSLNSFLKNLRNRMSKGRGIMPSGKSLLFRCSWRAKGCCMFFTARFSLSMMQHLSLLSISCLECCLFPSLLCFHEVLLSHLLLSWLSTKKYNFATSCNSCIICEAFVSEATTKQIQRLVHFRARNLWNEDEERAILEKEYTREQIQAFFDYATHFSFLSHFSLLLQILFILSFCSVVKRFVL